MSFFLPSLSDDALSSEGNKNKINPNNFYCIIGNHTFAVLQGSEEYNLMKNGFAPVITEINTLITEKTIEVKDEIYEIIIVLGGDYKVYQL